jgi:hypothetical protein
MAVNAAKNVADLQIDSFFHSDWRKAEEDITHTRNRWIGYDFKDRRIVPAHYSIRSRCDGGINGTNLKSWLIEVSMDGEDWVEVDHRENNSDLNGKNIITTFSISRREVCRFLRLVNIGRTHSGDEALIISSFEVFGCVIETGPQLAAFRSQVREQMKALGTREFQSSNSDPLNGIIAQLSRECGGNVHDRGVVTVISSGPNREANAAKNVGDLQVASYFHSAWRRLGDDVPHAQKYWIGYDFKDRRIVPTHYAVRSANKADANGPHLKSWLIEISMDGDDWVEVDRQENNSNLNGRNVTATFSIGSCKICRFLRLVNIGRNHRGNNALVIASFEIFGYLLEPVARS